MKTKPQWPQIDVKLYAAMIRRNVPGYVAEQVTMASLRGWSSEDTTHILGEAKRAVTPDAPPLWVAAVAPPDGWVRDAVLGCTGDQRYRVLWAFAASLLRANYPVSLAAVVLYSVGQRWRPKLAWSDVERALARMAEEGVA